ncbi:MAG: DnaD domain protein [Blautia sp.]
MEKPLSGTCFQTALYVILYVRVSKSIQPQRVRALRLKMTHGYQRKGNNFLIGEDMNSIQLQKKPDMDVTLVRNVFLDEYMPEASGEFVKIYLYLLRCASGGKEISMGRIADIFEHTEKDVARALKYWEKMQLLSLTYDSEGNLTSIDFLEPSPKAAVLPEKPAFVAPPKVPLSPDRIAELKSHDDMEQLLFIAARYIGRPLTSTEIGNILYYYDSLHFSTDLIEYLVEYCVSKGNKSCHYMEKGGSGLGRGRHHLRTGSKEQHQSLS